MPLLRYPTDTSIGSSFADLGNALGAAWDPKTRWEAYALQQRIAMQNFQWQQEIRKQRAKDAVERTYAGRVKPEDFPIIQNLIETGASPDDVEKKIAQLTNDDSYFQGPAAATAYGTKAGEQRAALDEERRRAAILSDPRQGLWDFPSANPTPEQIRAVLDHNRITHTMLGDPQGSEQKDNLPNMVSYNATLTAQQKQAEARATAQGEASVKGVPTKDISFPLGSDMNPYDYGDPRAKPGDAVLPQPSQQPTQPSPQAQTSKGQPPTIKLGQTDVPVSAFGPAPSGPAAANPAQPTSDAVSQVTTGPSSGVFRTPPRVTSRDPRTGAITFEAPPEKSAAGVTADQRKIVFDQLNSANTADDTIAQLSRMRTLSRQVGQPGMVRNITEDIVRPWMPGSNLTPSGRAGEDLNRIGASLKGRDPAIDAQLAKNPELNRMDPRDIDSLAAEATVSAEIAKEKADLAKKTLAAPNGFNFDDYKAQADAIDATKGQRVQDKIKQFEEEANKPALPQQQQPTPAPATPAPATPPPVVPPQAPPAAPLISGTPPAQAAPAAPAPAQSNTVDWNDLMGAAAAGRQ